MDPYLEAHWGDVHARLVMYASDALRPRLPGGLYARVEERVFVESNTDLLSIRYPDVRVVENSRPPAFGGVRPDEFGGVEVEEEEGGVATATLAEPIAVELPEEEITERFVEIRDAGSGHRVVTVIEVLSHYNKQPGEGRDVYLRKQRELREGGVSLVELDLLRSGKPTLPVPITALPLPGRTPYRTCVWRSWKPRHVEVYPAPLRQRLPVIAVPLRETDRDAPLDLQALLNQTYENGNYALTTDYSQPPAPPLSEDDTAWAATLVKNAET
jgi:hypothetical protein